jgi:hypothetical protein
MMNHSCGYNVIVGFDGGKMFVRPARPLHKDEQLFMTYVDSTTPLDIRRNELRVRYYFECECSKCKLGYNLPEEQYSIPDPDPRTANTAEIMARSLKKQAADTPPIIALAQLKFALQILQKTAFWPLTRQPSPTIRDDLILAMLSEEHWHSAFAQSAVRLVTLDPVLYPFEGHPIRHLHAYSLVKLAIYLCDQHPPAKEEENLSIYSFDVDLSLIGWSVLTWIIDKDDIACTSSIFKETVKRIWLSAHDEFRAKGLDPQKLLTEADKEWKKMRAMIRSVLEQEVNETHFPGK